MKKYGKSLGGLLRFKGGMFEENSAHLEAALASARLYVSQPRRERCKICGERLAGEPYFTKHGVPYALCASCGHLNGMHEDTDDFLDRLYVRDGGKNYAANYLSQHGEEYLSRVREIYSPKAAFLLDALRHEGCDPSHLSYLDLGAGAGYFVGALALAGIAGAQGVEVSESQVNLGCGMFQHLGIEGASLRRISLDELPGLVRQTSADVLSMIGVLEHLQNPGEVLQAIKENPRVRYLIISVPLFSLSVMIEAAFPQVFPRHLSGGHTHLFTQASLAWMAQRYGLETVAEWWFGTDTMDVFRSLMVTLQGNGETKNLAPACAQQMAEVMDELQLCLDRRHLSSEVHLVYKVHHD